MQKAVEKMTMNKAASILANKNEFSEEEIKVAKAKVQLEKIKQDLTKLSTEMSNTQNIAIKIVDRFNVTDRTSQSHREAVVKELNELSQDIAEVKGSVSRINGRH